MESFGSQSSEAYSHTKMTEYCCITYEKIMSCKHLQLSSCIKFTYQSVNQQKIHSSVAETLHRKVNCQ